jgi:hypothetical protein
LEGRKVTKQGWLSKGDGLLRNAWRRTCTYSSYSKGDGRLSKGDGLLNKGYGWLNMEVGYEMEMVGFGNPGFYGGALDLNPDIVSKINNWATLQRVRQKNTLKNILKKL